MGQLFNRQLDRARAVPTVGFRVWTPVRSHGRARLRPFERPSTYAGCALKLVIGVAIFWLIGRLEVADRRRPTFGTARSKPAGQDMGLNVSKVASISSTGAPGIGHYA